MSSGKKSICVDCVLFTLKDVHVPDNKYVSIFYIWFSVLCKTAELDKNDLLNIKMDTRTYEYLSTEKLFTELLKNTTFQKQIIECPPPSTLKEGAMLRYTNFNHTQDIYMYCDIDVLILKSLHHLTENMIPNTIYLQAEGRLSNSNYGAAFTKDDLAAFSTETSGFSSGKFFIYGKDLYDHFTSLVIKLCEASSDECYTLDQPYLNKAIYMLKPEKYTINFDLLNPTLISINIVDYSYHTTCFLDAMGIPGEGSFHLQKMVRFYVMFQLGLL